MIANIALATNPAWFQGAILVGFVAIMYFLLIRPQRKKEKQVKEMRDAVRTGDEIVTIGGIKGRVVKTKDDSIVIQVGADKVKFEMMRWSVSQVINKNTKPVKDEEYEDDDAAAKKSGPRKLKKAGASEEAEAQADADGDESVAAVAEKKPARKSGGKKTTKSSAAKKTAKKKAEEAQEVAEEKVEDESPETEA